MTASVSNVLAVTRVPKNHVRRLREEKCMTQIQLADSAKVARRTIYSVEKGNRCRRDISRKIVLALGFSFEQREVVFPRGSSF